TIAETGGSVRFVGRLSEAELKQTRAGAAFVLAPARWEEPCPYSVLDALASGVPVLGSPLGGVPELLGAEEIVHDGDWSAAVRELWADRELRARRGQDALTRARSRFGEDRYYERLIELYG